MQKRYQVVINNQANEELKESYSNHSPAFYCAKQYVLMGCDGAAVYDIITGKWVFTIGNFRKDSLTNIERIANV